MRWNSQAITWGKKNDEGWRMKENNIELAIHTIKLNAMTMHEVELRLHEIRWHYMRKDEGWSGIIIKMGLNLIR